MNKCYIVVNTFNTEAPLLADKVVLFLKEHNVDSVIYTFSGDIQDFSAEKTLDYFKNADFVITLGGDGTVLFASRFCASLGIPVFPINLGQFGFIAGVHRDVWEQMLSLFLENKLSIAKRSMVYASVIRGKNSDVVFSASGLNEIVISARNAARIVTLDVSCTPEKNEKQVSFGKFRSDGIIIATATGSTAYSAAAGGPIVDPSLDVFVLNPVCPFSLSNRPIVLSSQMVLEVTVLPSRGAGVILSVDGQVIFDVNAGDKIILKRANNKALLAGCDSTSFYSALQSKLNWSGSAT